LKLSEAVNVKGLPNLILLEVSVAGVAGWQHSLAGRRDYRRAWPRSTHLAGLSRD